MEMSSKNSHWLLTSQLKQFEGNFFLSFCCLLVSLVPGLEEGKEIRRKTTTNERNNETMEKSEKKKRFYFIFFPFFGYFTSLLPRLSRTHCRRRFISFCRRSFTTENFAVVFSFRLFLFFIFYFCERKKFFFWCLLRR